jgi:YD repeat-containing protein
MKTVLAFLLLLTCSIIQAQYYYNDIIGTAETNKQMQAYLTNKVATVSATGTDQRGAKATDFSEFHEVKENGKALRTSSIITLNKKIVYCRFDDQVRVTSMVDSSGGIASVTTYEYNAQGKLVKVQNTVSDPDNDFNQAETHFWIYKNDGSPEKMWRVMVSSLNNNIPDSLEVRFVNDDKGNPVEERSFKKGRENSFLYYYFDEANQLTDIVRYNNKVQKLLPDILLTYDDDGRVIQRITTTSSLNLGYLTWRYIYNKQGLKTKEALFNKDKELTGRIDYTYTFSQ